MDPNIIWAIEYYLSAPCLRRRRNGGRTGTTVTNKTIKKVKVNGCKKDSKTISSLFRVLMGYGKHFIQDCKKENQVVEVVVNITWLCCKVV